MKSVHRTLFLSFICLLTAWSVQAQCLCADMRFRLVLPGLQFRDGQTNYRIRTVTPERALSFNHFDPAQITGDTVRFSIPTGGGIDSLVFTLSFPDKSLEMNICVLHMHYDIDYFIDLTTFAPGTYLFDWEAIGACQQQHREGSLVHCGDSSFHQLKLVDPKDPYWPQSFVHHQIRPYPLQSFRIKK
ncbi:MAG: hypothetical protein JNL13_13300 [Chitinophagaceae bacterium]|nr:hypothetical protein [Chitinophagaceae bacterium]